MPSQESPPFAFEEGFVKARTRAEREFAQAVSVDYAWRVAERLTRGGRIVGGTERARRTALWIRDEMVRSAGMDEGHVALEEFPLVGYEIDEAASGPSVGRTSLEISTGSAWKAVPAAQILKGGGTGPEGVTAEIVDVGTGRLKDFAAADVRGKILLFTATEPLFYGAPVQSMASRRGAVGAIMHWPIASEDALRLHTMAGTLPLVSISNRHAARIRRLLAHGPVVARLLVDNRWDGEPKHTGYNVLGYVPGSEHPDEFVYLAAHFDHWFGGAADNNAGVGSLLAIAQGLIASGLRPARTLVFASFDAEELGGWADSWYDWLIGSYSHIVRTLDGRRLHPDLPGKIVAMVNMDVVGTRGADVLVETSPDLSRFMRKCAVDSGLSRAVPTRVVTPNTSYDDWPFYMVGVPATQTAWWGPAYDPLYHSTEDTMERIDPANVRLNCLFHGIAMIRAAQSRIHPYDLRGNVAVVSRSLGSSRAEASHGLRLGGLSRSLRVYGVEVERLRRSARRNTTDEDRLNRVLREAAKRLNPRLFVWDFSAPLPGWGGVFVLQNPLNDLGRIREAIDHLRRGRPEDARKALVRVSTMQWGQSVDSATYKEMLRYIYCVRRDHILWGKLRPPLVSVHAEFTSLGEKIRRKGTDFSREILSLEAKARILRGKTEAIATGLARSFEAAAWILRSAG